MMNRFDNEDDEPCQGCEGKGQVLCLACDTDQIQLLSCPRCNNQGEVTCQQCNGTGVERLPW